MLDILELIVDSEKILDAFFAKAKSLAAHPDLRQIHSKLKEARHLIEVQRGDRIAKEKKEK